MRAEVDSIPTRQSLLERLKAFDNNESWKDFFDTYWNLIYSMGIRSGLRDAEAQDLVQETIICVARSMPTFKYDPKIGSFKAWLRKLTRWRIFDQLRKRKQTAPEQFANAGDLDLVNIPDESDQNFENLWEDEWRAAMIEVAATKTKLRVDEKQFQIFDLYALQGMSVKKVASTLRISQPSVYVAKHRVGKIFEEELKNIDAETAL